jgi:flagellar hook-associated protein 3 FlgL
LAQTLTDQLTSQETNIAALQEQLATGQALNKPSDNPAAVTQVLALSGQASQLTSWQTNAETATSWLGTANDTANSVLESMQSAQTLLLQSLNQGAQDPTTYQALGDQLKGVVSNLLGLSNTQYEGRPIFAGTSASSQAYDANGNYLGNGDVPTVVIGPGSGSGQAVGLSVPGTSMFGTGASNVFATLNAAATALQSGAPTSAELNTALDALNATISSAQQASAVLGDSSQQVASVSSSLTTQIASVQSDQANLEDVNIATVTTQLDSETTNYQAALWAASKSIPETLVSFIA